MYTCDGVMACCWKKLAGKMLAGPPKIQERDGKGAAGWEMDPEATPKNSQIQLGWHSSQKLGGENQPPPKK